MSKIRDIRVLKHKKTGVVHCGMCRHVRHSGNFEPLFRPDEQHVTSNGTIRMFDAKEDFTGMFPSHVPFLSRILEAKYEGKWCMDCSRMVETGVFRFKLPSAIFFPLFLSHSPGYRSDTGEFWKVVSPYLLVSDLGRAYYIPEAKIVLPYQMSRRFFLGNNDPPALEAIGEFQGMPIVRVLDTYDGVQKYHWKCLKMVVYNRFKNPGNSGFIWAKNPSDIICDDGNEFNCSLKNLVMPEVTKVEEDTSDESDGANVQLWTPDDITFIKSETGDFLHVMLITIDDEGDNVCTRLCDNHSEEFSEEADEFVEPHDSMICPECLKKYFDLLVTRSPDMETPVADKEVSAPEFLLAMDGDNILFKHQLIDIGPDTQNRLNEVVSTLIMEGDMSVDIAESAVKLIRVKFVSNHFLHCKFYTNGLHEKA